MRVWIDLTNSPHVVIFAPLVERMRARGWDVDITARDFAQTLQLLELHGIDHTVIGHHGGGSRAGKARAAGDRVAEMVSVRARSQGRRGLGARLHRPADGLSRAAHPEHHHVRLRVRPSPACAQLPAGQPRAGARRDSAQPARPVRRAWLQAGALSGAEGGVLPGRVRARPGGAPRSGLGRQPHRAGAAAARRCRALPPVREPAVRSAAGRSRPPRGRASPCCCPAPTPRPTGCARSTCRRW